METSAVPLLAEKQQGYNDCFCLAQQNKMIYWRDKEKLKLANKKGDKKDWYSHYHMTFEEADRIASMCRYYDEKLETLMPSFYLENAKYNDLFVFVIDFDKMEDKNGKKQPVDTEAPFFIDAKKIADHTKMSTNGGYHMYLGINKETATLLFDSINLLVTSGRPSYVCKKGAITLDKRIKVDLFCDTGRLIYERAGWDSDWGLTDKTQEIYELIKANFSFERTKDNRRSSANNTTRQRRSTKSNPKSLFKIF